MSQVIEEGRRNLTVLTPVVYRNPNITAPVEAVTMPVAIPRALNAWIIASSEAG